MQSRDKRTAWDIIMHMRKQKDGQVCISKVCINTLDKATPLKILHWQQMDYSQSLCLKPMRIQRIDGLSGLRILAVTEHCFCIKQGQKFMKYSRLYLSLKKLVINQPLGSHPSFVLLKGTVEPAYVLICGQLIKQSSVKYI